MKNGDIYTLLCRNADDGRKKFGVTGSRRLFVLITIRLLLHQNNKAYLLKQEWTQNSDPISISITYRSPDFNPLKTRRTTTENVPKFSNLLVYNIPLQNFVLSISNIHRPCGGGVTRNVGCVVAAIDENTTY